jgi:hypothetical protein
MDWVVGCGTTTSTTTTRKKKKVWTREKDERGWSESCLSGGIFSFLEK